MKDIFFALSFYTLWLGCVIGWFLNIYAIIYGVNEGLPMTGSLILRIVGIVVWPVGGVLGWL